MVRSFIRTNFTLNTLLLMTVVMNTIEALANFTIYYFPFLNVHYTPDSDRQCFKSGGLRKSLVELKVSNWKSDLHPLTGRVLMKNNQKYTQLKARGNRNVVQWSPLETGR